MLAHKLKKVRGQLLVTGCWLAKVARSGDQRYWRQTQYHCKYYKRVGSMQDARHVITDAGGREDSSHRDNKQH
jgi:hypothetical protein